MSIEIEVAAQGGSLRGEIVDGLAVFRGIRYARAPFGPWRFAPPQPVVPWDGVVDATAFGPGCPQPSLGPATSGARFVNPATTGEDCLSLNVWTPEPGPASRLPVMVWIHGGGFAVGSGGAPVHDGTTWARDGIVYVSINYRLNVEGFIYLGEGTANLGLLDQVAALRWVRDNIAAFGGDPDNVTIFGQSGGAVGVMHLLAMPSAAGLFRRAIAQSGSSLPTTDVATATAITRHLATLLEVPPSKGAFAAVPPPQMASSVTTLAMEYLSPGLSGADAFLISPFRPVIDGDTLPADVLSSVASGSASAVDLLAGTCRDEATFAMQPFGLLDHVPDEWAAAALAAFGLTPTSLAAYRETTRPGAEDPELFQAAWTDWAFRMPTLRLLEAHAGSAAGTFAYEFAWPSPTQPMLGAIHALDIPFVNDDLARWMKVHEGPEDLLGHDPPAALADLMHRAWIGFATHGDPGWAPYDALRRITMRFDTVSGPVEDLAGPERRLWSR